MYYPDFEVAKYEFLTECLNSFELPAYKGSMLRGGFGSAFKTIACSKRGVTCKDCMLRHSCPYGYVFETSPREGSELLANFKAVPRPFIIEPPLEAKRYYRRGDKLTFGLVLVGKAIDYLPYFVLAFDELGRRGIGRDRGKYALREVMSVKGVERTLVYSGDGRRLHETDTSVSWEETVNKWLSGDGQNGLKEVSIRFLTPARIRQGEDFVKESDFGFHHIIGNLLWRIRSLAYFHCGESLDLDINKLVYDAGQVEVLESELYWHDRWRYSGRQKRGYWQGGIKGKVKFGGDVKDFMPFLLLGEYIHIGSATTFGLGKFKLERANSANY